MKKIFTKRSGKYRRWRAACQQEECVRLLESRAIPMLKQVTFVIVVVICAHVVCAQSIPPSPAGKGGAPSNHKESVSGMSPSNEFDVAAAERFARLALACVHKEYPNKISHSMNSDADVAPPRKLTPAFYGCYDWHSSVHGHWLLVRLVRKFPDAPFTPEALTALRGSLTADNIREEAAYLNAEGRASFERPYGLAWFLQLAAEVHEWEQQEKNPVGAELSANLRPL